MRGAVVLTRVGRISTGLPWLHTSHQCLAAVRSRFLLPHWSQTNISVLIEGRIISFRSSSARCSHLRTKPSMQILLVGIQQTCQTLPLITDVPLKICVIALLINSSHRFALPSQFKAAGESRHFDRDGRYAVLESNESYAR